MSTQSDLEAANTVAWIIGQNMVTENGRPFEFFDHRFLLKYLADDHRHKVSKKSSQIGETVGELFDDFHLAIHRKMNVIHTLHTNDVLKGFVQPKVDPIILQNPAIAKFGTGSQGLKSFGNNFVYFRGANAESQAISISADVLKIDEKDRSDPHVVEMFQSRLDFSNYKWIREFSNPSAVGFGVDENYSRSDQRHWFVKCTHCNYNMYIDFEQEKNDMSHYVDQEREIFACGKCHRELSDIDRTNGDWVAKWPSRDKIHGYWFSQMMAPWFTAGEIVDKFKTTSTEYFYNFVLGKAYTPSDLLIDREAITKALKAGAPRQRGLVMGSDIGKPHWYWIGSAEGLLKWGRAETWEDLEYLFNFYQCEAWVMDSMPEFTQVQKMLRKYPGKAYAAQFNKDRAAVGIVRWQTGDKRGFVYVDRTKIIDRLVTEINSGDIKIFGNESDVAEFIAHASNMYRSVEVDDKGTMKIDWLTKEGKPDHLVFGLVYWRVALEKAFSGVSGGVIEQPVAAQQTAPTVKEGKVTMDFNVQESLNQSTHDGGNIVLKG